MNAGIASTTPTISKSNSPPEQSYSAVTHPHLRTTNPLESTFATIRHRPRPPKGCGSVAATLAMVLQLARVAEKHWRRLNGYELLARVIAGVQFVDGVELIPKAKAA